MLNGVVYVGGGDSYWYALDASTGAVLWRVNTGDNSAASGHYNWSSPLIVNGYAYIGVASLGDCPLVQGQLIQVDLATHAVVNTLNLVPDGSVGGGIWTSPAYDPALNEIFAVTGTETSDAETYAQAVVGIDASSLTVKDYWHLPETEAVADSDWTTSTGLYTGSNGVPMLVATNKNGYTYAFDRTEPGGRAHLERADRDRERLRGLRIQHCLQRGDLRQRRLPGRRRDDDRRRGLRRFGAGAERDDRRGPLAAPGGGTGHRRHHLHERDGHRGRGKRGGAARRRDRPAGVQL